MNIEKLILSNLIFNEEYARKVLPFLRADYFSELSDRVLYELTNTYIQKYNTIPTVEAITIDLTKSTGLNEDVFKNTQRILKSLQRDPDTAFEYLIDNTERFCQDRALYLAVMQTISIMDNPKNGSKGSIPEILTDALAVSFDSHIGHDFLEDAEERYEFYHVKEKRIPFNLEYFNKITQGGLPNKTLMILLAGVNVGKSAFMCDMAACHLDRGYKVLYITLEMAEVRIAERIEANLMDIPLDDLRLLLKDSFDKKISKIKERTTGKLIIKEYPTTMANVGHFRHLLSELKIKKNFVPDIVYIDYINICASSRFSQGSNVNSYTYIKSIAEELRGLAVEKSVPIVSATQLTRQGFTCLHPNSMVCLNGNNVPISNIKKGDLIEGREERIVEKIVKTKRKIFQITLEDGRKVICSSSHRFPTLENQLLSIETGLQEGMSLLVKNHYPINNVEVEETKNDNDNLFNN